MRVLLGLLVDFAWLLYVVCGVAAAVYVFRAISLQRQQGVSYTAFERETTARQIASMWRSAVILVLVGVALAVLQVYMLPQIIPEDLGGPDETPVGVITPTPSPTPTATPQLGALPTITVTAAPPSTPPPIPTPEPTAAPVEPVPAISVGARFGNVAELVGYDVAATDLATGQALGLTLYWRALEGASSADYWVFNHLVAASPDVRLVAQHDGAPAGGTRPTTSWTVGELVTDYHELVFVAEEIGYTGAAEIRVGLYDPAAQVRLTVEGGGDFVVLPTPINVTGQ